jgi:thioredoxin reductase (NADPH)
MSIIDTRRDQMFPVLEPAVIERLRRFGEVRSYPAGAALVRVGDAGHGLTIILAGNVDITEHQDAGASRSRRMVPAHSWANSPNCQAVPR